MRRRDEGWAVDLVNALLDVFRRYPAIGLAGAAVFFAVGAYFYWINPRAMFGTGIIWSICSWMISGLSVIVSIAGASDRRKRIQRLESQRTIADLKAMTWLQFEQLVADLFRRRGFRVREVGGAGDGGVDLILQKDAAEHLVQCKQYRDWNVGTARVREFYGAMAAHATRCEGIIVTCGRFTRDAEQFAEGKPLRLIEGDELLELISRTNTVTPAVESFTSQPPAGRPSSPSLNQPSVCRDCGAEMVRRVASRGDRAGEAFWECRNYPRCKRIVDIGDEG